MITYNEIIEFLRRANVSEKSIQTFVSLLKLYPRDKLKSKNRYLAYGEISTERIAAICFFLHEDHIKVKFPSLEEILKLDPGYYEKYMYDLSEQ